MPEEERGKAIPQDAFVLSAVGPTAPTPEEGLRLLEAFRAIDSAATRAQIIQLVESMLPNTHAAGSA